MRIEDVDFLTYANDLLTALEQKNYVIDDAPDCPGHDKRAQIVTALSFPIEDSRFHNAVHLASTALIAQIPQAELEEDPQRYSFAATRYHGKGAFYVKAPETTMFDFAKLHEYMDRVQDMFQPKPLSSIRPGYEDEDDAVCIGPIDPAQRDFFETVINCMGDFHEVDEIDAFEVKGQGGSYFVFEKNAYALLLRNPAMLEASSLYRAPARAPDMTLAMPAGPQLN